MKTPDYADLRDDLKDTPDMVVRQLVAYSDEQAAYHTDYAAKLRRVLSQRERAAHRGISEPV